jgi:hypothetical protein
VDTSVPQDSASPISHAVKAAWDKPCQVKLTIVGATGLLKPRHLKTADLPPDPYCTFRLLSNVELEFRTPTILATNEPTFSYEYLMPEYWPGDPFEILIKHYEVGDLDYVLGGCIIPAERFFPRGLEGDYALQGDNGWVGNGKLKVKIKILPFSPVAVPAKTSGPGSTVHKPYAFRDYQETPGSQKAVDATLKSPAAGAPVKDPEDDLPGGKIELKITSGVLRAADWSGKSSPFVSVKMKSRGSDPIYDTQCVSEGINPVWDHDGKVGGMKPDKKINLLIQCGETNAILGRCTLRGDFYPRGFDGILPIEDCAEGIEGHLKVQVNVLHSPEVIEEERLAKEREDEEKAEKRRFRAQNADTLVEEVRAKAKAEADRRNAELQAQMEREEAERLLTVKMFVNVKLKQEGGNELSVAMPSTLGSMVRHLGRNIARRGSLPVRPTLLLNGEPIDPDVRLVDAGIVDGTEIRAMPCKAVVTSSADHTARVWNAETAVCEMVLEGHEGPVNSARFAPDCFHVVTSSDDGTARLWTTDVGKMVRVFEGHKGAVYQAEVAPNCKDVVTCGEDCTIKIWVIKTGLVKMNLIGHHFPVINCTFVSDTTFRSSDTDGALKLWDSVTYKEEHLGNHKIATYASSYSPRGKRFSTTRGESACAMICYTEDGECQKVLLGHGEAVTSAYFAPAPPVKR